MEANQWEKQVVKCETKAKLERLTSSTKNHLKAAAEMSQKSLLKQLAVVTGALEELLCTCGNLGNADKDILDALIDDLVKELEEQREAIEELGERTEPLLAQVEERKVVEGASLTGGEPIVSKKSYTFKNMTHMEHPLLLKEVRPAELRSWEVKFDSCLSCSMQ